MQHAALGGVMLRRTGTVPNSNSAFVTTPALQRTTPPRGGALRCGRGTTPPMPNDSPWWRRPGVRLRHDMHLWIRHDAARFVRPGFDPADVFPTLARKADAAKAAAFEAEIAARRRLLAELREEVAEIRADMKRRRAL